MTTAVHAIRLGHASRIQVDLLRRLGRVRAIIVGCAGGALAIEIIQARLTASGSPLESLAGPRFLILGLLALAWGGAVWRGEGPKNRQYFLSQPVDVSVHELSRIAAGAWWLTVALAGAVVVAIAGAIVRHDTAVLHGGVLPWIAIFTGALLIYLAVSVVATLTSRVAEVLIFSYLGLVVLIPLLSMAGFGQRVGKVFSKAILGSYGLRAALVAPNPGAVAKWIAALAIWYAVVGAMIVAALWWRRGRSWAR